MKKIEYLKPFPELLERSKGTFLESFTIANIEVVAVKNKKSIEIIYNGVSFYNNFGRQSMTVAELKNSLAQNALKTEDFNLLVKNWCDKQMTLPIKEKPISTKPKKVYHKFINFAKKIEDLKGICTCTFVANGLNFEVYTLKKVNYICFEGHCVSVNHDKDYRSFADKITLYDYSASKIKSWINLEIEKRK